MLADDSLDEASEVTLADPDERDDTMPEIVALAAFVADEATDEMYEDWRAVSVSALVGAGTALLVESETIWALAKLAARARRTVFVKCILSIWKRV